MSGPKRSADKLNTIGIVVVGVCSAVLVYVTIVALQAFYMDDTSEIQTMADYGGQDTRAKAIRAEQAGNITKPTVPNSPPKSTAEVQTYRIPIAVAMQKVVEDAKKDPSMLVPAYGKAKCRTVLPDFGRAKADDKPPCAVWGQPDNASSSPAPSGAPTPAAPTDPQLTPT
ncbi:MAG: hypothetical protein H0V17_19695, partial [Deltaproteobacteria bacterium]|nr:hypothetical protein [Deltaproteobacteria bacterium]